MRIDIHYALNDDMASRQIKCKIKLPKQIFHFSFVKHKIKEWFCFKIISPERI